MVTEQGFTGHGKGFFRAFWIELAIYVVVSAALIATGSHPGWVVLGCAVTFALLRLLMVLANFWSTWRARSPKRAEHEIGVLSTLAMILREWWAAIQTYPFLFAFEPWLVPNNPPADLPHKGMPVVLVPGFFTNRGYLYRWRKALLAQGYGQTYALSPEPIFHSVEKNAEHLAEFVDEVLRVTGAPKVILIGHSMGGLVIRLYLHRFGGLRKAAMAVACGSPFNGTVLAVGKENMGPIVSQLTPNNAWSRSFLDEIEAAACPIPFVSIWSPHDSIVSPQDTTRVADQYGHNIVLPGVGHMEMVSSKQVTRVLIQLLDDFNGDVHPAKYSSTVTWVR